MNQGLPFGNSASTSRPPRGHGLHPLPGPRGERACLGEGADRGRGANARLTKQRVERWTSCSSNECSRRRRRRRNRQERLRRCIHSSRTPRRWPSCSRSDRWRSRNPCWWRPCSQSSPCTCTCRRRPSCPRCSSSECSRRHRRRRNRRARPRRCIRSHRTPRRWSWYPRSDRWRSRNPCWWRPCW